MKELTESWLSDGFMVLRYVWPTVLGLGVFLGIITLIILSYSVRSATESYAVGIVISSVLLLVCKIALLLPRYLPEDVMGPYQYADGYMIAAHDWFWFTACWLLVVMVCERILGACRDRRRGGDGAGWRTSSTVGGLCRPLQAAIVTVIIFCLCFVAALPQFWAKEVVSEEVDGTVRLQSTVSDFGKRYEYRVAYFWFRSAITIFVTLPLLLFLSIFACFCIPCSANEEKAIANANGGLSSAYGIPPKGVLPEPMYPLMLNGSPHRRYSRQPISTAAGFYLSEIWCYIIFTGPYALYHFLPHVVNKLLPTDDDVFYRFLDEALNVWFHVYFVIQFCILLAHSANFMQGFVRCCCCCKDDRED